jgi:serine protease Do
MASRTAGQRLREHVRRLFAAIRAVDAALASRVGFGRVARDFATGNTARSIQGTVPGDLRPMTAALAILRNRLSPPLAALCLGAACAVVSVAPSPALARGPEGIADVAEKVIDAVVNISTSQTVDSKADARRSMPQLPPGSPFEEFFEDFFKNRRGDKGNTPRKVNSLGSGFIIDSEGLVVTNNHVISDADEISVVLNDGTKHRAEVVGRDKKTDLALLKFKPPKPLTAVKFGDSDKLRLGEWVVAIGNPFSLGGTVTAGIVSARNRDINSGPYDNYIQTDAAINRGNSGGPMFNLDGEVVGVNTAIISPSGGSIGIGFAVPSKTVVGVIDQLREFGETRRGWLGVRIQQVTDEIAESLEIKPARGALIAGVDDKGPARPAGIEPGDVVVTFDGKAIKEMKDLPRAVADTAVGKTVDVVVIRKGKEVTKRVTLGRLEDGEKLIEASAKSSAPDADAKPPAQKALGLDLAALTKELRARYKIKDSVKGVLITDVDSSSDAAEKRLSAGDVLVEVAQEAVSNAADVKTRIEQVKKDGKKSVLLLVSNADGELRFVALSLD